ncbi:MAG: AraC family transcriptional regulator [Deltaproteobacteria bacterium]|nr:AraC family transcriptional regulator [Deltaproteobacteria bacterium]
MKPAYYEGNIPVFTKDSFFQCGEHVYIHESTDFPAYVGTAHKHEFIEFVYVLSGEAKHAINGMEYDVMSGDLIIINYDATHAFYANTSHKDDFVTYDLMFTPDFLDAGLIRGNNFNSLASSFLFYSMFPEKQEIGPDLHLTGSQMKTFREIFDKIYLEFHQKQKGYVEIIRAYVVELIIYIFRQIERKNSTDACRHKHEEIVYRTLRYLYDHYQTQITLEDLAAQIFLSKDYFSRLFREITGKPVSELLQQIRIEEACKLLISTDETILEVANECGYQDIKFFYATFRKLMGMTPGEYRKANR